MRRSLRPITPELDKDSLLKELSDAVLVSTKEGNLLYFNPSFPKILGYSKETIEKKNLAIDLVDRDLEWKALISLMEQGGIVQDYEIRLKRADGGLACCTVSASNLRDTKGKLIGLAMVVRDITTRKGVENELREKAYRIDVMNKIAKLTATEQDSRMQSLVKVSAELRKIIDFDAIAVGVTEENGRHVEILAPSGDDKMTARTLGKIPFEGSIVEKLRFGKNALVIGKEASKRQFTEYSVMNMNGIESILSVPLASRGRIIGSINVCSAKPNAYDLEAADVMQMVADQVSGLIDNMILLTSLETKIKLQDALVKTGLELQKASTTKEIYAAIATNIRNVVDFIDLSFYVVDWSERMIHPVYATGEYADEVMANPGTVEEGVVGSVARTGQAEFTDDIDSDPRVADIPGVPKEHNTMLAIPLYGPEGVIGVLELYRPKGQVFTISDLEAGKLFAQQASVALSCSNLVSKLQEAKKEIEMLNDLMFHDINNFNFATLNYVQLIASSGELGSENKAHLEKSLHLIKQTAELIESVKKLTKIGIMDPKDFVTIDLVEVLRKIVSGVENSNPGKGLEVSLSLPESAPVVANKLVEELYFNLISNAVKYDPHEKIEIEIKCEKVIESGKAFWRVCISDHGAGVPDSKKGQLFQKHVRLKPDLNVAGSGMGLSICRALADKFGGRVWVEDRVPGKYEFGAKFCTVLPSAK